MQRTNVPTTLGLIDYSKVRANTGQMKSNGVDISLDYKKNFSNGLWVNSHSTFTFATNKIVKIDEPDYSATPWLSKVGNNYNQGYGYIAERLFIDQYDINISPSQSTFGKVMAGDIKYKDINKDGVINGYDVVAIGHPTSPEINYGFGISAGYKGVDLSFFFQGTGRRAFWIDPTLTAPFINASSYNGQSFISGAANQLLQAYADDHWTEANQNPYALWPRLSPSLINNNSQRSTWFMRNGSFMRLKDIECGYSLPKNLLKKSRIESLRVYYSGTNLLTFSNFKLWDPEMGGNGLAYPIQKTHNVGLQLSF